MDPLQISLIKRQSRKGTKTGQRHILFFFCSPFYFFLFECLFLLMLMLLQSALKDGSCDRILPHSVCMWTLLLQQNQHHYLWNPFAVCKVITASAWLTDWLWLLLADFHEYSMESDDCHELSAWLHTQHYILIFEAALVSDCSFNPRKQTDSSTIGPFACSHSLLSEQNWMPESSAATAHRESCSSSSLGPEADSHCLSCYHLSSFR